MQDCGEYLKGDISPTWHAYYTVCNDEFISFFFRAIIKQWYSRFISTIGVGYNNNVYMRIRVNVALYNIYYGYYIYIYLGMYTEEFSIQMRLIRAQQLFLNL